MFVSLSDGQTIFVEHHESPKNTITILIVHGGPGESSVSFKPFIHEILKTSNVVEIDQRECGRSPVNNEGKSTITLDRIICDFDEIREKLGIRSWVVLGHSFGGFLALEYINNYPQTIDGLILECPAIDLLDSLKCILDNYIEFFRIEREYELMEKFKLLRNNNNIVEVLDAVNNVPNRLKVFFWGNDKMNKNLQEVLNFNDLTYLQKRNCCRFFNIIKNDKEMMENGWEKFSKIECPILLLKGEDDKIINQSIIDHINKNGMKCEIKIIKNSGHYIHLSNIVEMHMIIEGFLRGIIDDNSGNFEER